MRTSATCASPTTTTGSTGPSSAAHAYASARRVHVFNNYYSNVNNDTNSYAIASLMNAGLLVEANVFENVQQACWSASGYADSDPGRLVARNNSLTNSGPCETNGTVAPIPYGYTADDVNTVKSNITANAGAGKL